MHGQKIDQFVENTVRKQSDFMVEKFNSEYKILTEKILDFSSFSLKDLIAEGYPSYPKLGNLKHPKEHFADIDEQTTA
jgi:hypothetical protein